MKYITKFILIACILTSCSEVNISDEDHKAFITGKALSELPCEPGLDSEFGTKKIVKEDLDSNSIQYIFDSSRNTKLQCPMRAFTRIRVNTDTKRAIEDFKNTLWGAKKGIEISGSKLIEDNAFYSFGNQSSFYYITHNGKKVGIYFISRVNNITYALNLWPIIFDTPERLKLILEKRINYVVNNSEQFKSA